MATKSILDLFGIQSSMGIECPDKPPRFKPTAIQHYVFRTDLVRDMLVFWRNNWRACMLTGHKGSGKTSIVEQMHERMGVNLESLVGHGKMTIEDLFGQLVPTESGSLIWRDGPVASAARHGHSVIINEFNAIPEDLQLALMEVAHQGAPITLPQAGQQFQPAPGFRIFATINPKGSNDFMYKGRKEIDAALKERFFWIKVPYGTRAEEEKILSNVWRAYVTAADGDLGIEEGTMASFVKAQIDVAEVVRARANSTGPDAIPEILSTRVLCNWAMYWIEYANQAKPMHIGLERALTNSSRHEVAYAIHKIVEEKTNVPSPYTLTGTVA